MKAGRVIGGDEHDARSAAEQILAEARAQAAQIARDATQLATQLVQDAREEAERLAVQTAHAAAHARANAPSAGVAAVGTVDEVVGLVLRATVPGVALGEVVKIARRDREPLAAEVVGLSRRAGGAAAARRARGRRARGCACGAPARRSRSAAATICSGASSTGSGAPIDGGPPLTGERLGGRSRRARARSTRPPIIAPQPTGVRAIDTMLTLGRGQRVGLFAAAGVGKSTLLGQIARGAAADVIVLCLVGERGRELAELLGDELAPARARTVVVCATSDAPPLVRLRAVHVATAIAEWFRDRRGASVLLLV